MAMYCLNLLRIALELAQHNRGDEDIATKFFDTFSTSLRPSTLEEGRACGMKQTSSTTTNCELRAGGRCAEIRSMVSA